VVSGLTYWAVCRRTAGVRRITLHCPLLGTEFRLTSSPNVTVWDVRAWYAGVVRDYSMPFNKKSRWRRAAAAAAS